jgi:mono/diheme cytochrome c family protein
MTKPRWTAAVCALATAACEMTTDWGPDALGDGQTSQSARRLERGRELYALYCAGCHGEQGDGEGVAARFLDPKPRDFRLGRLKFAAVSSGEGPSDEDYLRVITTGLSGTAMPSFALLSLQEREAIVAFVATFRQGRTPRTGTPIALPRDPFANDPAAGIEAGKKAYHVAATCWACHPAYASRDEMTAFHRETGATFGGGRPNLYQSEVKDSAWGVPIRPPDFLSDRVKTGLDVESLARVIGAGIGGTAMPSWAGALDAKQLWGIAYYVRSLALTRGTPDAGELRRTLLAQTGGEEAP